MKPSRTHALALAPIVLLLGACASTPMTANTSPAPVPSAAAAPAAAGTTVASTAGEQGRDWTRVDSNRDHLVSPAEMEAWLAANPGPLRAR